MAGIVVGGDGGAGGELRPITAHAMVVIELGAAHADGDVEGALFTAAVRGDGDRACRDHAKLLLGDLVGHEVGRWIGFLLESAEVAV